MVKEKSIFRQEDVGGGDFRRISGFAITCFVFSILAVLIAFATKTFIFLPVVVAALSVLALCLMHFSRKKFMGYSFAAAALFVSLFGFAALTSFYQHQYNRWHSSAIEKGDQWLELLKTGQMHAAYQMHFPMQHRKKRGFNLEDHYGTIENPKTDLAMYLALEPERLIFEDGQNAKITLTEVVHSTPQAPRTEDFHVVYRYERDGEEPRFFSCHFRRFDSLLTGPAWHIVRVNNVKPAVERVLPRELEDSLFRG